jgi:hypothetical protein
MRERERERERVCGNECFRGEAHHAFARKKEKGRERERERGGGAAESARRDGYNVFWD